MIICSRLRIALWGYILLLNIAGVDGLDWNLNDVQLVNHGRVLGVDFDTGDETVGVDSSAQGSRCEAKSRGESREMHLGAWKEAFVAGLLELCCAWD